MAEILDVRSRFLFNRNLHTLHHSSLPFCADLLSPLESNEGELEVVGGLLERSLMAGLRKPYQFFKPEKESKVRTNVAWRAASFLRSSDPRFAIARVVSVRS